MGAGEQLAGELYAAAGRVWSRMRHEMEKEKEVGWEALDSDLI